MKTCFAVFFVLLSFTSSALGESVTAQTSLIPGLVMENSEGKLTGFTIDFGNALAEQLDWDLTWELVPFEKKLTGIQGHQCDMALGGITITEEREEIVDFTHPYFDSALGILVTPSTKVSVTNGLTQLITWENVTLFSKAAALFFILGALVWVSEYRCEESQFDKNPIRGLWQAYYFANTTATSTGYGDFTPKTVMGQFFGMALQWMGLPISGIIIGIISAVIIIETLDSDIKTPSDLTGRVVATKLATTGESAARRYGAIVVPERDIETAIESFENGNADCVVYDIPALMYHVRHEGSGKAVVSATFEKQSYGIALPTGSSLREDLNRAILSLKQSGEYDKIYDHWFGGE